MKQREKVGMVVLIGLFAALALALYLTVKRPSDKNGSFEDNVLIDQRMRNVNKSR